MNLFRSEEHITAWLGGREPGMTTSVQTLNDLAQAWWGNRLDPSWSPRTKQASQAILDSLGLTGPLWHLG
jgi:hypothetical protein